MTIHLPYKVTKSVEEILNDPDLAKKVIKTIEEYLSIIEKKQESRSLC